MNVFPGQFSALNWALARAAKAPKAGVSKPDRATELASLKSKEMDLWHKWNDGGRKQSEYDAMLKSHMRIINYHLGKYRGAEVNREAQKATLLEGYRTAVETYNPKHEKGASLTTHINTHLKRLQRFNIKHQNPLRITEPLANKIGTYKAMVTELTEKQGVDPTHQQLADYAIKTGRPLSKKEIIQLSKQMKSVYDISVPGEYTEGAGLQYHDPYILAAHIIYPTLKPHSQKVHELMFPKDGRKPITAPGEIAKKLRWDISKVSKARGEIRDKINAYVGE